MSRRGRTRLGPAWGALLGLVATGAVSCRKVPIFDIEAGFDLADATWFEGEETLFLFYQVHAEQGINEPSAVEVTYDTDTEHVDWRPLSEFTPVHHHVPIDCGTNALCGSTSIHVPREPRDVRLRLRYHPEGELALDAQTSYNVVPYGPAYTGRSLLVYGVFDATNERVQWRSRHHFPTLRNEQVEELGLRRDFTIRDQRFGEDVAIPSVNPYGYGAECPQSYVRLGFGDLSTNDRARFNGDLLPLGASGAAMVCAEATVTDATPAGSYTTTALARKNPEVRPAFPVLRSPIHDATPLPFFLGPCRRTISPEFDAMLRQRLQLAGVPVTCTDDWQSPGFVEDLVVKFRASIEAARPAGDDMVLVIALSEDEPGVPERVEEALVQVVPDERLRSSPRLAGAFVLDSTARGLVEDELSKVTLWCPSTIPFDDIPDASARTCAVSPDQPDIVLGPFSFNALPILPTREQYLDFINTYSEAQAGNVTSLAFRTPEFATTTEHVEVGDFGVATFLNDEHIGADADDAFSYCVGDAPPVVAFRSPLMQDPAYAETLIALCYSLALPAEVCSASAVGLTSLEFLPDWHNTLRESRYDLGIVWDFPFLLRMDYEVVTAGSVSAFGLSVPFGISTPAETYYGTEVWIADALSLDPLLSQCTRFCDHPTFDSAAVYHVTDPFRTAYAHNCYQPTYPMVGDSGFPLDP